MRQLTSKQKGGWVTSYQRPHRQECSWYTRLQTWAHLPLSRLCVHLCPGCRSWSVGIQGRYQQETRILWHKRPAVIGLCSTASVAAGEHIINSSEPIISQRPRKKQQLLQCLMILHHHHPSRWLFESGRCSPRRPDWHSTWKYWDCWFNQTGPTFTFDHVFDESTPQSPVFENQIVLLVDSCWGGSFDQLKDRKSCNTSLFLTIETIKQTMILIHHAFLICCSLLLFAPATLAHNGIFKNKSIHWFKHSWIPRFSFDWSVARLL